MSEDNTMHDEQNTRDTRNVAIDKVGIKGLKYPIEFTDKSKKSQHTIATMALSVDLPQELKGTHMSRFVQFLNVHGSDIQVEKLPGILKDIQARLESHSAYFEMEFPFFIEKKAPVSGQPGLVDYVVRLEAEVKGGDYGLLLTVVVPVATLCPCSKAISVRGAHNQRGHVTLSVKFDKMVWVEDLISLVEESASCELYSLLKRSDEKYVTEKAFDNPNFVEDVVRNVALRCNEHPDITWYQVEVENFESIHNHSAYAIVSKGS